MQVKEKRQNTSKGSKQKKWEKLENYEKKNVSTNSSKTDEVFILEDNSDGVRLNQTYFKRNGEREGKTEF